MRLKNWIYSIVARNNSSHLFHDDFNVCHILQALRPLTNGLNFFPSRVTEISFCQNLLAKDQTRCFMMFSMPVGHSVSLTSLPCVTNSVHHESFKSCTYSKVAGNCSNHFFMITSMSVGHSATFNLVLQKPNYLLTESLQISCCQKLLEAHQAGCFILMVRSVRYSLNLSSPRRRTNSLHHVFRKLALFNSWRKQLKWLLTWWL